MSSETFRSRIAGLLAAAGIEIDGPRPQDIQVHDDRLYARVLAGGSLALGEAYVDGWWDCPRLDEFFACVLRARLDTRIRARSWWWPALKARLLNLVGRKLGLEPGQRLLDIGCGWGGTARYLAERYGVEVVGITVSRRQAELASEVCRGLPVEIRLQDYRDLVLRCDRILSLGMFEHVGCKNYRTFMEVVHRCLADDGLFLLHTIAGAGEGLFVLEDWHNLGPDYDRTLRQWHRNFQANWATLKQNYDERFYRTWEYYLLSCAGSFRARKNQVWQIVFSPCGVAGGFRNRI